jgi:hypothetical protein
VWKYRGNELSWRANNCSTDICAHLYTSNLSLFQFMQRFNKFPEYETFSLWIMEFYSKVSYRKKIGTFAKQRSFYSDGFLIFFLLNWAVDNWIQLLCFSRSVRFVIRCFYYPWSEVTVSLLPRLFINIIFVWNVGKDLQYHIPSRSNQYKSADGKMVGHRNLKSI